VLGKKNFLGSLLPRKTFLNRPLIPLNIYGNTLADLVFDPTLAVRMFRY